MMGWARQLLPQLALAAAAAVAATSAADNETDSAVRIHIEATVIPGMVLEDETPETDESGTMVGNWLSVLTDTWWKTALWGLAAALLFILYFYLTRYNKFCYF